MKKEQKVQNMHVSQHSSNEMLSAALSAEEKKWYDRVKEKIASSDYGYYCSWWLRLDYEDSEPNLTTSKINYWLTKLVKKGLLTKKTAKSHTQYSLIDIASVGSR